MVYHLDHFSFVYFIPLYFVSIALAILLFGFTAFTFTRMNHTADGVVLLFFFSFAFVLPALLFNLLAGFQNLAFLHYFSVSPLLFMAFRFDFLISRAHLADGVGSNVEWVMLLFWSIVGVLSWVGLFLTADKHKAEDAKRRGTSYFGYPLLMCILAFFGTAVLVAATGGIGFAYAPLIAIGLFVFMVMFSRGVKFDIKVLIAVSACFLFGLIVGILGCTMVRFW